MTLTIDLQPELETRLREEAARLGLDPRAYVVRTLQERLTPPPQTVTASESELVRQINAGLPAETWQRYHGLLAKRRAEALAPAEHQQLIALSDQIEQANARRMQHLLDLARLRGTSLEHLVKEFGIPTAPAGHG